MKIGVFLIGDHVLFRTALAGLLKRNSDISVLGYTDLTSDASEGVRLSGASVALLLAADERGAVSKAAQALYAGVGGIPVIVVLQGDGDPARAVEALRLGARGLLDKNADGDRLASAIRDAHRGDITITPRMATHLVADYAALASARRSPHRNGELSDREVEVLALLARGQTNQQIAQHLCLSVHTVRAHLRSVMQKLGVRNRVQAAAYAFDRGMMSAPAQDTMGVPSGQVR